MFGIGKKKEEDKEYKGSPRNTQEENDLLIKIDTAQQYAEGGVRPGIEVHWEDEYKIKQGGGQQWDTTKGLRTAKGKKRNFNSEDNFVLPMIRNMLAPFSVAPTMEISGAEAKDDEAGGVLNDLVPNIMYRNKFPEKWNKGVEQFVSYGPIIGCVEYDQHWIGGTGPDKWVGEIKVGFVKKDEFYPDPAILDLEERLQECSHINIKKRKKIDWYKETWPEKGQYVTEDTEKIPEGKEDEGQDPKQATLIEHFHKGTPYFISDEWKQKFLERAKEAEEESKFPYYAKDLRDMATGTLKGVHCAYKANTILLDYIPYIYDDGLYPFVYRVLYADEKQPYGMGEIRNVVIPQILHNKADEIELGAMLGQGLGGALYNKGALTPAQKEELMDNLAKANAWHEVQDINGIHEKKAVQVPPNTVTYKNGKKDVIDLITGNTAIVQGLSIGANVPYKTVAELGARADANTRRKAKILEGFMIEFVQLIINRIAQFYTEDRKYRILGDNQAKQIQAKAYKVLQEIATMPQGTPPEQQLQAMIDLLMYIKTQKEKPKSAVFKRNMLVKTFARETGADGTPKLEEFIPEFDIKVKIAEDKPTDRNYYVTLATELLGTALGIKAFWKTIDEGKFPSTEEILAELDEMRKAQAEAQAQAQQAAIQMQQQDKEADRQAGLEKIDRQGQAIERQTVLSAMAKAGAK
jgi:hypothetical protein